MTEVEILNVALSMWIMIVIGAIGGLVIDTTKYAGYARLWAILWVGPPLVVLWGYLVTYIVLT